MDKESAPALGRVALGLAFVFAGLALLVVFGSAFIVLTAFTSLLPLVGQGAIAGALILALALHLTGQLLCLWVPAEAEARGVLLLAVAPSVLAKALAVVDLLAAVLGWWPQPGPLLSLSTAAQAASVLASVAFLIFLKRLAHYVGDGDYEIEAEGILVLWVAAIVLWALLLSLLLAASALLNSPNLLEGLTSVSLLALVFLVLFVALGLLLLFVGLVTFIKYCNLLTGLRDVILRHVAVLAEDAKAKKSGLIPS
jgi:hypothetical protein